VNGSHTYRDASAIVPSAQTGVRSPRLCWLCDHLSSAGSGRPTRGCIRLHSQAIGTVSLTNMCSCRLLRWGKSLHATTHTRDDLRHGNRARGCGRVIGSCRAEKRRWCPNIDNCAIVSSWPVQVPATRVAGYKCLSKSKCDDVQVRRWRLATAYGATNRVAGARTRFAIDMQSLGLRSCFHLPRQGGTVQVWWLAHARLWSARTRGAAEKTLLCSYRIDSRMNYSQPVSDKCAGCGKVSCRTSNTQGTLRTPTGTSTDASCHCLRRRWDESLRALETRCPSQSHSREVAGSRAWWPKNMSMFAYRWFSTRSVQVFAGSRRWLASFTWAHKSCRNMRSRQNKLATRSGQVP
jgi:hypothetical protein